MENIVSCPSPESVFGVLRVSQAFRNTLEWAAIQEKLFLRVRHEAEPLDDLGDVSRFKISYRAIASPFVTVFRSPYSYDYTVASL